VPDPEAGLPGISLHDVENPAPPLTRTTFHNGWTPMVVNRVQTFCTMARLSSAINERAALHYQRIDRIILCILTVLTIVASTDGANTLVTLHDDNSGFSSPVIRILVALCNICCTVLATLSSRFEWGSKAKVLASRAAKYARMSMDIVGQLCLDAHQRVDAQAFLETISRQNEELQGMADPVPLSYRRTLLMEDSIMSMWGGSFGHIHDTTTAHDPGAGPQTGTGNNVHNEAGVSGTEHYAARAPGPGHHLPSLELPLPAHVIRNDVLALMNLPPW
jgi:hypothetical protein